MQITFNKQQFAIMRAVFGKSVPIAILKRFVFSILFLVSRFQKLMRECGSRGKKKTESSSKGTKNWFDRELN